MATRYYIRLPNPALARGNDDALAFRSESAGELATELEQALRTTALFDRWRDQQDDPEGVEPGLGATDPQATVVGSQRDLAIDLVVTTRLPGDLFKMRLRWLAGSHWQLRDVSAG
ncbi:MAG TPA: hypothetical protein VKM35_12685 [Arenimonas sp.]|nr:hypothetical protein [Arenimonas sp.]HMB58049.1 hypothetical protein [Arenimonas sp.]